jgi:hypothetical protein
LLNAMAWEDVADMDAAERARVVLDWPEVVVVREAGALGDLLAVDLVEAADCGVCLNARVSSARFGLGADAVGESDTVYAASENLLADAIDRGEPKVLLDLVQAGVELRRDGLR